MRKVDLFLAAFAPHGVSISKMCNDRHLSNGPISHPNYTYVRAVENRKTSTLRSIKSVSVSSNQRWRPTTEMDVGTFSTFPRRPFGTFVTSIFRVFIAYTAKFIMKIMNTTHLHDPGNNLRHLFDRNDDVGILTISNHQSVLDDPGIWCGILPVKKLRLDALRTILVAEEWFYFFGCFGANVLYGLNCLPIKRGNYRSLERIPALYETYRRLNGINERAAPRSIQKKEWVHIMVEGELFQSWRFRENHAILGKFKKGAAKIVACSPPFKTMVLPLYHKGMDEILPEEKPDGWESSSHRLPAKTKSYVPKRGKAVNVYVGEPIDFTDLLPSEGFPFENSVDKNLLDKINARLFNEMLKLESVARSIETKNKI